jgi:hypothetical protein
MPVAFAISRLLSFRRPPRCRLRARRGRRAAPVAARRPARARRGSPARPLARRTRRRHRRARPQSGAGSPLPTRHSTDVGRPVTAPMLRTGVAAPVEVVVPEVPRLTGKDAPAAPGAGREPSPDDRLERAAEALMPGAVPASGRLRFHGPADADATRPIRTVVCRAPGVGLQAVSDDESHDRRECANHDRRTRPCLTDSAAHSSDESAPSPIASVPLPSPARDRFVPPQHPHPSDPMTR